MSKPPRKDRKTKFKRRVHSRLGKLGEQEQQHLNDLIRTKVSAATKSERSAAVDTIKKLNETLNEIQSSFKHQEERLASMNGLGINHCDDQGGNPSHLPNEHECGYNCWVKGTKVDNWHLFSPLEIPLRLNWERVVDKSGTNGIPEVYYIAPCGKKMSSMEDIQSFLYVTGAIDVHISQFTFDPSCCLETTVPNPTKNEVCIEDITSGKEARQISCVNFVNDEKPEEFTYSAVRTYERDVDLRNSPDSLVCCSCTDNCRNKSCCHCRQLTIEEAWAIGTNYTVGYVNGRLKRHQYSAVYECNSQCGCGPQCSNRVVQRGITHRLQVFRSRLEELKWGVRTLDDIPKGTFVCTYIGHIYTEKGSDEKALQHGDEYFAELDYIEVIQKAKDGYESDVISVSSPSPTPSRSTHVQYSSTSSLQSSLGSSLNSEMDLSDKCSDIGEDTFDNHSMCQTGGGAVSTAQQDSSSLNVLLTCNGSQSYDQTSPCKNSPLSPPPLQENGSPLTPPLPHTNRVPLTCSTPNVNSEPLSPSPHNMSLPSPTLSLKLLGKRIRQFYNEDFCYIMDAKKQGNIGRFINHSCSPNLFVQNVFIDTHDCRFPWVALFAKRTIKAMEELTWDYNYEVGSVPGREIKCLCGAPYCRGRLL